jgi:hypothetical protein
MFLDLLTSMLHSRVAVPALEKTERSKSLSRFVTQNYFCCRYKTIKLSGTIGAILEMLKKIWMHYSKKEGFLKIAEESTQIGPIGDYFL